MTVEELPHRLSSRIVANGGGCWLWVGHTDKSGYGIIGGRPRPKIAHREVFEAVTGYVPPVLHHLPTCPKNCVNPEHLEPTTHADHPDSAPAWQSAKERCAQGHPFDAENTYYPARGGRVCRRCRRENMRRYSLERG